MLVWLTRPVLTVCFLQTEDIEEGVWMVPMNLQGTKGCFKVSKYVKSQHEVTFIQTALNC